MYKICTFFLKSIQIRVIILLIRYVISGLIVVNIVILVAIGNENYINY
jgi:hypothetical protein